MITIQPDDLAWNHYWTGYRINTLAQTKIDMENHNVKKHLIHKWLMFRNIFPIVSLASRSVAPGPLERKVWSCWIQMCLDPTAPLHRWIRMPRGTDLLGFITSYIFIFLNHNFRSLVHSWTTTSTISEVYKVVITWYLVVLVTARSEKKTPNTWLETTFHVYHWLVPI